MVALLMPTNPPAAPRHSFWFEARWSAVASPVAKLAAIVPLLRPAMPPAAASVPALLAGLVILPLAVTSALE